MLISRSIVQPILTLLSCLWNAGSPASADESRLKEQVLSEYPKAIARMEESYSRVHGEGDLTMVFKHGMPEEQVKRFRISFARNGNLKKLVRSFEGELPKGAPASEVYCGNSKYTFTLRREAKESPFIVSGFGKPDDEDIDETIEAYVEQYLIASHAVFGMRISTIMADPSFSIQKASEVTQGGQKLIRVDYDYQPEKILLRSGWVLVCPEKGWALQEYETQIGNRGRRIKGTVEFEREEKGIAVPRRVTEEAPPFLDTQPFQHTFEFEKIVFRGIPEKEFTLSAFGLPEMGETGIKDYRSHTVVWILGGAAVALLAAVIMRKMATRYRT